MNKKVRHNDDRSSKYPLTFVDIFAGCGGLSLGLMQAGWEGIFAIEHDEYAFQTLKHNLLSDNTRYRYAWPEDLPKTSHEIDGFLEKFKSVIDNLTGKIDLLVGGPPCQGFSSAGKRDRNDPRNKLVIEYLKFVEVLKPRIVVIENVRGITTDFPDEESADGKINYANWLIDSLSINYNVHFKMLSALNFGVPQRRQRFFLIAFRKGNEFNNFQNPFDLLDEMTPQLLIAKGLTELPITSKSAISDLEIDVNGILDSRDSHGFQEIGYIKPVTRYQKLMRNDACNDPADTRLARHKPHIVERFQEIIDACQASNRLNTSLSTELKKRLGIKKSALRVLDPNSPSPTITSMPDDLLHYKEPRTLTVRENARLQSFPDWFEFKGKYTSGGNLRRQEVPRFTQVANAVPPLMAEAIGMALTLYLDKEINCSVGRRGEFRADLDDAVALA